MDEDGRALAIGGTDSKTTITNTTFSGNQADRHGGAIWIRASAGKQNLRDVTIFNNLTDNDLDSDGDGGALTVEQSEPTISISNSTIQGNDDKIPTQTDTNDCTKIGNATYLYDGGNIFGSNTGCPVSLNDATGDALLVALTNNGGSTETYALESGGAAIDFAVCDSIIMDQRSLLRVDGQCDAGAYELGATSVHLIPAFQSGTLLFYTFSYLFLVA